MSSAQVLAHYDPELPIKLDCDASAYGVGAVLTHMYTLMGLNDLWHMP